jgi:hypothetical protein
LEQSNESVKRGFGHRLLVERHERALFIVFHFVDHVLNLLRTNIVILFKTPAVASMSVSAPATASFELPGPFARDKLAFCDQQPERP